jgi:hypothetical protein
MTIYDEIRRGMIPAYIYNDAEIFARERKNLFSRAWLFVGHESEIPQAGDYVVRRILDDSFIIVRDEKGEIRAHFNMCLRPTAARPGSAERAHGSCRRRTSVCTTA